MKRHPGRCWTLLGIKTRIDISMRRPTDRDDADDTEATRMPLASPIDCACFFLDSDFITSSSSSWSETTMTLFFFTSTTPFEALPVSMLTDKMSPPLDEELLVARSTRMPFASPIACAVILLDFDLIASSSPSSEATIILFLIAETSSKQIVAFEVDLHY